MNQTNAGPVIVVIPLFNEQATVPQLIARTSAAIVDFPDATIQIVDDGSVDGTVDALRAAAALPGSARIAVRRLSRNFGLQRSIIAGLDAAVGRAAETASIVVMDGDLQDRPEDIPLLLRGLDRAEVACATRATRRESLLFRILASVFYAMFQRWAHMNVPANSGNFCALSRRAACTIVQNADENVFFPGLRAWIGFRQTTIAIHRDQRADGDSRMGYRRLVRLAIGALFGYSQLPLKLMVGLSAFSLTVSFVLATLMSLLRVIGRVEIQGIALLVVITLFCFSMVSVLLTTLAYMVSRSPAPTQQRRLFVVDEDIQLRPIHP